MTVRILSGDCRDVLRTLRDKSSQCCVTSPPYFGLRDYGVAEQIGLEKTPDAFVAQLVEVFREVRRVLCDDGTLWLNLGDSYVSNGRYDAAYEAKKQRGGLHVNDAQKYAQYDPRPAAKAAGLKPKDLMMIPARVALALQADGWYLRSDIIWHKPNPMPESVADRPTSAHEHVFLLTKSERYFYDAGAIREPDLGTDHRRNIVAPVDSSNGHLSADKGIRTVEGQNGLGRNCRNVWSIPPGRFKGAHFATMPTELAERCIKAGSKPGDTVLDPFGGSGTTGLVANQLQRNAVLIDLNPEYVAMTKTRIDQAQKPGHPESK